MLSWDFQLFFPHYFPVFPSQYINMKWDASQKVLKHTSRFLPSSPCLAPLLEPLRCFPNRHLREAVHTKTSSLKSPNLSYTFTGLLGLAIFKSMHPALLISFQTYFLCFVLICHCFEWIWDSTQRKHHYISHLFTLCPEEGLAWGCELLANDWTRY